MIVLAVAVMLAGASEAETRHNFSECLNRAMTQAQAQKVAPDAFIAFAQTACGATAAPFEEALVKTNVGHGMARKAAQTDAASQVTDYYSERLENYRFMVEPAPTQPAPTQAAAKAD